MPVQTPPTVWVDDSQAIVRRGMVACLTSQGFCVRGESARLTPLPKVDDLQVLVFEVHGTSLRQVRRHVGEAGTHLVATVRTPDERQVRELVESGVAAVLLHSDLTPETLGATVSAVVAGRAALPRYLLPRLLVLAAQSSGAGSTGLNPRERDVLRLLAEGHDTREIAADLCYSERTVKNVVHDVLMKMNCRTRAHAVALATREGVI
jgi:DNA-binding NarL/FixJ family response regulator